MGNIDGSAHLGTVPAGAFSLRGAVEIHAETASFETLRRAAEAGVEAVVVKWAGGPDSSPAAGLLDAMDLGTRFFGGVVLDAAVGGMNEAAVRSCIDGGGVIVWMPVKDAVEHRARNDLSLDGHVPVVDRSGELLPEVRNILALVADAQLVLGTGHLGPEATKAVVGAAVDAGIEQIVLNHPLLIGFNHADLHDLMLPGVSIEHCYVPNHPLHFDVGRIVAAIDEFGVERSLLGDFGDYGLEPNVADALLVAGLDTTDLQALTRDRPKAVLGRFLDE